MITNQLSIDKLRELIDFKLVLNDDLILLPRDAAEQIQTLLSDETMLRVWTTGYMSGHTSGLGTLAATQLGHEPSRELIQAFVKDADRGARAIWADPVCRNKALHAITDTLTEVQRPHCDCGAPWHAGEAGR